MKLSNPKIFLFPLITFCILNTLPNAFVSAETISKIQAIQLPEIVPLPVEKEVRQIELTITAPFSMAQVTVFSDGHLRYEASSPQNNIHQSESKTIAPEEFQNLANLIVSSHFDTLDGNYGDPQIVDATTFQVNIQYSSVEPTPVSSNFTVNCNALCPHEVIQIIDTVKRLWGGEILEIGI